MYANLTCTHLAKALHDKDPLGSADIADREAVARKSLQVWLLANGIELLQSKLCNRSAIWDMHCVVNVSRRHQTAGTV